MNAITKYSMMYCLELDETKINRSYLYKIDQLILKYKIPVIKKFGNILGYDASVFFDNVKVLRSDYDNHYTLKYKKLVRNHKKKEPKQTVLKFKEENSEGKKIPKHLRHCTSYEEHPNYIGSDNDWVYEEYPDKEVNVNHQMNKVVTYLNEDKLDDATDLFNKIVQYKSLKSELNKLVIGFDPV